MRIPANQFERMNEARGIAEAQYTGIATDYSSPLPEKDRVTPTMGAYDGIFKTSYKFPPYNPDQLIGRLGYDFMENMLNMAACWASFNLKRYTILREGWRVEPAVVDPQSTDHEESKFYADALRYCLNNVIDEEVDYPQDFVAALFDQQMAAWLGYRVANIEFRSLENTSMPGLDGKYGFTGFWGKTNKQIGFDVDPRTLSPKRFVSYTPDGGYDGDVHPESVWCYTHAQTAMQPHGKGDARPVYKNYFALDVLQKLWAIALERWGAPVFVAQYPSGADTELQAALTMMNEIRQGQSPIIPDNIKYQIVAAPAGVFAAFESSADWHVRQIALAINSNTLSTGEGKHGATSAGSDQHAASALSRTVARTCSDVRWAASANAATWTPHSYSQTFRAQVRSITISRSRNDSGPRSSRLPPRNFSQARAWPAITRNSISGGAPRMMRSNCAWISGA